MKTSNDNIETCQDDPSRSEKYHEQTMKSRGMPPLLASLANIAVFVFILYVAVCLLNFVGIDISPWN